MDLKLPGYSGDDLYMSATSSNQTCQVDGCTRPKAPGRGVCHGHHARWRRHQDVQADVPLRKWARKVGTSETVLAAAEQHADWLEREHLAAAEVIQELRTAIAADRARLVSDARQNGGE